MKFNEDTYVDMGEYNIANELIWTNAVSTCRVFLISGVAKDTPFAFLDHNSFALEESNTKLGDLHDMLRVLKEKIEEKINFRFGGDTKIKISDLENLRLLVAGGAKENKKDREREALSLLINPTRSFYDLILPTLDDAGQHLFRQLCYRTVVIKEITYVLSDAKVRKAKNMGIEPIDPPGLRLFYNCRLDHGLMAVEWTCAMDHLDIAYMWFHMLSKNEHQYQWEFQNHRIKQTVNTIGTQHMELEELQKALSYIPAHSFFVPSLPSPDSLLKQQQRILKQQQQDDENSEDAEDDENSEEDQEDDENSEEDEEDEEDDESSEEDEEDGTNVSVLKFIKSENDLQNRNIEFYSRHVCNIFRRDQIIYDNEDLKINIYCLSSSLNLYVTIDSKNNQQLKADDFVVPFNKWIQVTTNFNSIISELRNGYKYPPFGQHLGNYKLKGEESSPYFIYCVKKDVFLDLKFRQWFSRLELLPFFSHHTSSTIDKEDPNWIIYLHYQQYENDYKQICYAPIGFITVYLYYASFHKKRARINPMLILPPYQGKGHERCLLTTIYNDLRKDSCIQDITVYNPSNEFMEFRDFISLELCHKYLPDLFSKELILKTKRLTEEMIDKARDTCKLTKQQTQRVYEIFLLAISEKNKGGMKRFRHIVMQRVFHSLHIKQQHNRQLTADEIELMRAIHLATEYEEIRKSYAKFSHLCK